MDARPTGMRRAYRSAAVHVVSLGDAVGVEGVHARGERAGGRVRHGLHAAFSGAAKDLRSEDGPTRGTVSEHDTDIAPSLTVQAELKISHLLQLPAVKSGKIGQS